MYTVYYDENAHYADKSEFVKIHKFGCPHHTKNDDAVKNHSGERPLPKLITLIEACAFVEKRGIQLSSTHFCKHCFGQICLNERKG